MANFEVSSPGKVILFGEHSVVYGKTAIAVSLNLRTTLKVIHTESQALELHVANYPSHKWAFEDIKNLEGIPNVDHVHPVALSADGLSSIKKLILTDESFLPIHEASVAVVFLAKQLLISSRGLKLEVSSQLPLGAGLGSSASFSVCIATAFHFIGNNLSQKWQDTRITELNLNWDDFDLINKWAFVIEKIFHGSPSGLDNNTSCYGGAIIYKSGVFTRLKNVPNVNILLVDTKVQRNTKEIVQDVRVRKSKYPGVIDPILESMDHLASTCVEAFNNETFQLSELYNILEELIDMNQGLLNALNVSHTRLQEVFSIADKRNFHAKLTGAGRGGFAFILIRPESPAEQIDSLKQDLDAKGFQCYNVTIGSKGVQLKSCLS